MARVNPVLLRPPITPRDPNLFNASPGKAKAVFNVDEGMAELDSNENFIKKHVKKFIETHHGSISEDDLIRP
jgi:hypothetical protein